MPLGKEEMIWWLLPLPLKSLFSNSKLLYLSLSILYPLWCNLLTWTSECPLVDKRRSMRICFAGTEERRSNPTALDAQANTWRVVHHQIGAKRMDHNRCSTPIDKKKILLSIDDKRWKSSCSNSPRPIRCQIGRVEPFTEQAYKAYCKE